MTRAALAGLAAAGTLLVAPPLPAQTTRTLDRPSAEYPEPFSGIRGVRELPDGRVLVSDLRDKVVLLLDLRTGHAVPVGREGGGPGEYALPGQLFALPGGATLLQDFGNQRYLEIGPDGRIGRTMSPVRPAADGGSPGAGMAAASMVVNSRGTDRQGNLYFQAIAFPREGETVDSLPLLRWDRASSRYDTAAWLPLNPEAAPRMVRRSAGRMTVRIGGGQAWPRQTEWAVSAEGRIALVSPDPYRVTWVAGPRRTTGPAVAYTPIRVTEAEKQAYRETLNRGTPVVVRFGGPGGGGTPTPSAAAPTFEEPAWPETLPPFTGRDAPQVSPDGELWVERTRRASDETPVYDVFDASGRLTAKVMLRPRSRVVGFGAGTVYVVRRDADDLQYLEQYRLR